jgi:hypothetical protein
MPNVRGESLPLGLNEDRVATLPPIAEERPPVPFVLAIVAPCGHIERRMPMLRRLLTIGTAIGLSLATTAIAVGEGMGAQGGANVSAGSTGTSASGNVRAGASTRSSVRETTGSGVSARGPSVRPHGWSEGKKTGWNCTVGSSRCKPPGLR